MTDTEGRAVDWADYRKDYQPNPTYFAREAIAFREGWNAAHARQAERDRAAAKAALDDYAAALSANDSALNWDRGTFVDDINEWTAENFGRLATLEIGSHMVDGRSVTVA